MEKRGWLGVVVFPLGLACATPSSSTLYEAAVARDTIGDAEEAGAGKAAGRPAELLAEAKVSLAYAQRLPADGDRALRLCRRAQADAALAIVLARKETREQQRARVAARQERELTARQALEPQATNVATAPTALGMVTP
jgi:hypothetical protein